MGGVCGAVQDRFGVRDFTPHTDDDYKQMMSALYLQVSIVSQALIFVTRSQGFSYFERPGALLMLAFVLAQLVGGSQVPCGTAAEHKQWLGS